MYGSGSDNGNHSKCRLMQDKQIFFLKHCPFLLAYLTKFKQHVRIHYLFLALTINHWMKKYSFSETETMLKLYKNLELKFTVKFQQCGNY